MSGTTAYLADGGRGLRILDVSDPALPALLATSAEGWSPVLVTVVGQRAYVGDGLQGVRILDVSTPAVPVVLGAFQRPGVVGDSFVDEPVPSGEAGSPGSAALGSPFRWGVQGLGPLAYIPSTDRLWVVDESDPANPLPLSSQAFAQQSWVTGRVFAASHPVTGAHLAYVARQEQGVEIIDVTDPYHPAAVGRYPVGQDVRANDVFVLGQIAYVPARHGTDGRLHLLDVSDPISPTVITIYDTPGDARRVLVAQHPASGANIAYVADGDVGLRLLDVTDPAHPVELSHIDPPAVPAATIVAAVAGQQVYVGSFDGANWWIQAYDITDPTHPALVKSYQGVGALSDFEVRGEDVYVTSTNWSSARAAMDRPAEIIPTGAEHNSLGVISFAGSQPVLLGSFSLPYVCNVTVYRSGEYIIVNVSHCSYGKTTIRIRYGPAATRTPTVTPEGWVCVSSQFVGALPSRAWHFRKVPGTFAPDY